MNRRILAMVGLIAVGVLLFGGGAVFARSRWTATGLQPGWMMGQGNIAQFGPGMMNGSMMPGNMMGSGGMMAGNMMGNVDVWAGADPLSIEEAEATISSYLASLNNDSLIQGEIMIFENHAYAQILDKDSDQGAYEVLIDPNTGNVFPEPGPNMMWNTEYGMMAGFGDSGTMGSHMAGSGMMGSLGYATEVGINVSTEEAVVLAQEYLDASLPGKTADEHVDTFPGYYTLHVLEDGDASGMLSVNAASGQVFFHHWHGDFVDMADESHE